MILCNRYLTTAKIQDGTILKQDVKAGEIVGEQGPPGPAGAQGPAGLPTPITITERSSLQPTPLTVNTIGSSVATCDNNEVVTGVGFSFSDPGSSHIKSSQKSGTGWVVTGFSSASSQTIQAFAECLKVS